MKKIITTILTYPQINNRRVLIFLFFTYVLSVSVTAQSHEEIIQFNNLFEVKQKHQHWSFAKSNNTNEIKFVFSNLYLTYKYFVSSQDLSTCVFSPSCSTYSIQCIKSHGLLIGTMESFDRLTRCNPLSPENYQIHNSSHRFIDNIED